MTKTMSHPTYAVRYTVWKGDSRVHLAKEFKTLAARDRWLDAAEQKDNWGELLATSDPQ